ncbi:hypothetical protein EAE99_002378 [Botrytis elliptica]|nr:hypothetical protein EAE99_002378 [Botrytis elliptica]
MDVSPHTPLSPGPPATAPLAPSPLTSTIPNTPTSQPPTPSSPTSSLDHPPTPSNPPPSTSPNYTSPVPPQSPILFHTPLPPLLPLSPALSSPNSRPTSSGSAPRPCSSGVPSLWLFSIPSRCCVRIIGVCGRE